jgi:K+-transporting ATPase c subunit
MLLDLDLQLFADGEDDLDLDSMMEEFESEWNDEDDSEGLEPDSEEPGSPESEPESDQTDDEQGQENPNPNDEDTDKRNRAFADLRRQADENKKYADFISRLAQDSGVSPEEILNRYQERQLEAEAEQQNVPVDVLKRLNTLEQENSTTKEQLRAERMETQIESVKAKYGADDNAIRAAFEEMLDSGIDPRITDNVNFEKFYRAANLESIIQKEVENARQKDLANKKQRQTSAAIGNGTSVSPSSDGISDDEFDEILKNMDIRL